MSSHDRLTGFGNRYRQASFTCRVFVPVGGQTQLVAEGRLDVI